MPDPERPSGAPISETEADRLSERFTASWDEPEPETLEPATVPRLVEPIAPAPVAPVAAPAAAAPAAPAQAPAPTPAAASAAASFAARPKATLLGMAPVVLAPKQPA